MLKKLFLGLLCMCVLVSCKKDDKEECTPPALATQIPGKWKALVVASGMSVPMDLEFTSQGNLIGNFATLLALHFPGTTLDSEMKYVAQDDKVTLNLTSGGAPLPAIELIKESATCEEIVLSMTGTKVTLTKP